MKCLAVQVGGMSLIFASGAVSDPTEFLSWPRDIYSLGFIIAGSCVLTFWKSMR